MTKKECAIIMAYTGVTMLTGEDFSIFHKYVEELLHKKSVYTSDLLKYAEEIKEKSKFDFLKLCREATDLEEKVYLHITFLVLKDSD